MSSPTPGLSRSTRDTVESETPLFSATSDMVTRLRDGMCPFLGGY
ncbi:MAG: hypothetical protein P8129_25550 [Anaerolineae bacterium]